MKVKVIVLEGVTQYYIELSRSVSEALEWPDGTELNIEPVVDKQGKVTHVVLEKRT